MSGVVASHFKCKYFLLLIIIYSFIAYFFFTDPRYPSVSRDVFVVNPTEGYLEANTSFTAKTKTPLKITFTAK